jgi:hypothetical protein
METEEDKRAVWSTREKNLAKGVMHFPELVKAITGNPDESEEPKNKALEAMNKELRDFIYEVSAFLNEYPEDPLRALYHVAVKRESVLHAVFVESVREKKEKKQSEAMMRFDSEQAIIDFVKAK